MNVYLPTSGAVLAALAGVAAGTLALGYVLQRTGHGAARAGAWSVAAVALTVTNALVVDEGAGVRMLALMAAAAWGMKAVVGCEARRRARPPLGVTAWCAFAAVWPGMQTRPFERTVAAPARRLFATSAAWLLAGTVWCYGVHLARAAFDGAHAYALGLASIVGFSMMLHFGAIGLLAATLRTLGFAVEPQFRAPWRATSLREFWSVRWNVAFSHLTQQAVYRPVGAIVPRPLALWLGFVFSGLLHELACSAPVRSGFGWPTAYFALHGALVALELQLARVGLAPRGPVWGRIWTFGWLLAPVTWVFHEPFVRGVLLPLT